MTITNTPERATARAWKGKLTRIQAIEILDSATDKDDPFWENVVSDFYDEKTDTMPSIMDVFAALGVTKEEYMKASAADNIEWPKLTAVNTHDALQAENERLREQVKELPGVFSLMRMSIILLSDAIEIAETNGYLPEMHMWKAHIADLRLAHALLNPQEPNNG